jgi:hypothetical protein
MVGSPTISVQLARRLALAQRGSDGKASSIRVVNTGSMEPLVNGDCTANIIWGAPKERIRRGCLIVTSTPLISFLVLHRCTNQRMSPTGELEYRQLPDSGDRPGRHTPFVDESLPSEWLSAEAVFGIVTELRTTDGRCRYDDDSQMCRMMDRAIASILTSRKLLEHRFGNSIDMALYIAAKYAIRALSRTSIYSAGR